MPVVIAAIEHLAVWFTVEGAMRFAMRLTMTMRLIGERGRADLQAKHTGCGESQYRAIEYAMHDDGFPQLMV
jgi:hypothetical protein